MTDPPVLRVPKESLAHPAPQVLPALQVLPDHKGLPAQPSCRLNWR